MMTEIIEQHSTLVWHEPLRAYKQRDTKELKVTTEVVRIDADRLWNEIHDTARFGGIHGTTGMERLALSASDKQVRDYFIDRAKELGCKIVVDSMGNIFAILPGLNDSLPPIGMGSHLDTQPNGGRYDGILGVLGALEVLRAVKRSGIILESPLAAVNWTNEEGARFQSGCTGSAVWSGYILLERGHAVKDHAGTSDLGTELRRIGYMGSHPADSRGNPLSGHFELHIEQGPRLERSGKTIGVVNGVQGNRRLKIHVQGIKAHSGSTPMQDRSDALVASAKIILAVQSIGHSCGGFATVGMVQCDDASLNSICGSVRFTVDLRNPSKSGLDRMEDMFRDGIASVEAEDKNLNILVDKFWESPAAEFREAPVSCIRDAASKRFGASSVEDLLSFAGHDSAFTDLSVPSAMIFVPSRNGISHAPGEYTSKEHCAAGVQALADAVIAYDGVLAKERQQRALFQN